jgi:hypothetical protein
MLFRNSLRFKGYWLALFSWIVLTFAAPVSSALAETDEGWMRLCSAHGVQWVNVEADSSETTTSDCLCLSLGLTHITSLSVVGPKLTGATIKPRTASAAFVQTYSATRPRSPPFELV